MSEGGRQADGRVSGDSGSRGSALSCCIIACNEESTIRRCLEAVCFADECVVVLDSRSSDATGEIARELGARKSSSAFFCVALKTIVLPWRAAVRSRPSLFLAP